MKRINQSIIIAFFVLAELSAMQAIADSEQISKDERFELYEEANMEYAKKVFQALDGSTEDEAKARAGDNLNYHVREKAIREAEAVLAKRKDPNIRRDLYKRLSALHQQQAEVARRRVMLADRDKIAKQHLLTAIANLEKLRAQFPSWKADIVLFEIAESYAAMSELRKAEQYYYQVIRRFSSSPILADALLAMGNLQFEKQRFVMARDFYGRIFRTPEKNLHAFAHYKIAWAYFNETDLTHAVQSLEAAILESRKLQAENGGNSKLGVEDEALNDMVLFFAEAGKTKEAETVFKRLVDDKRAKELRFNLAKRLFDYGKHAMAKNVAHDLLQEAPLEDQTNKLYLIVISASEKTGEREAGLETAKELTSWIKERGLAQTDSGRIETEEYLRHYSQKLHYEAETLKKKETWNQAEKSYEIYLDTFDNNTEAAEVKFRYAVLLMHQKNHTKAYKNISDVLASIQPDHKRFQESMKLRIQSIELASKAERKEIGDQNLLIAYDEYVKFFPEDKLATEAEFKAANLAKVIESPEAAATRFHAIAERNPNHNLAKEAINEALGVLVKAERWESLHKEAKSLLGSEILNTNIYSKDASLTSRLKEAEELALVKIAENQEKSGAFADAIKTYEGYAKSNDYPEKIRLHSLIRATELAEKKLYDPKLAMSFLENLRDQFPSSREGEGAGLELARLSEKLGDPEQAAKYYLAYSGEAKTSKQIAALTNAAAIHEGLGDTDKAAELFFRLSTIYAAKNSAEKATFYAAGCNNVLLTSNQDRSEKVLGKIMECADVLSKGPEGNRWLARKAWAEELLAKDASSTWSRLAMLGNKLNNDADRLFYAQSRLAALSEQLENFSKIRFSSTNEKPAANIAKKNQALGAFERSVKQLLKIGSSKQVIAAQELLRKAYLDFADTMETAALPSKLNADEQAELKSSFQTFADGFKKKADDFAAAVEKVDRDLASAVEDEDVNFASLEDEEVNTILDAISKKSANATVYARYASHRFSKGDYREARYYFTQWKRNAKKVKAEESRLMNALQGQLSKKIPDGDPALQDML